MGAVVLAALALAAGCSSSSDDAAKGKPGVSASSDTTGGGATGTPIKIMVTGTLNGPGIGYPEAASGAEAAADAINAAGGVDGHSIKIEVCDDKYDANAAAACAQKAVSDKVTALVGGVEFFNPGVYPTIEAAKIPWVAPVVVAKVQYTSPMSFPVDGGGAIPNFAMGREAVRQGGKKVVIVSIDAAAALANQVPISKGVSLEGGSVVGLVKYPPGNADFSATAASVMKYKPQAVVCLCSSQVDWSSLYKSLTQTGYDGPFSTSVTFMTKKIMKTLGDSSKKLFMVDGQRPFDSTNPAMAQYQSEINQYASKSAVRNQILGGAWLGVHVVAEALKGAANYDAAGLVSALTAKASFSTFGLVDKISFSGPGPNSEYPRIVNPSQIAMKYDAEADKVVPIKDEFFDPFAAGN